MASSKATLIHGQAIANAIQQEIAQDVSSFRKMYDGRVPGLAMLIVGNRKTYVSMTKKACREAGIAFFSEEFSANATEDAILDSVLRLNANRDVHGIFVQLPLPRHVNEERILNAICIGKDVDGFHPLNLGKLCKTGRNPLFVRCTPKGCIELLSRTGISIAGKRAAVGGRSNIVGMPVAMLLAKLDANVTLVHPRTPDAKGIVKEADIVIAAAGLVKIIKGDWIKHGAVVIDAGTNTVYDPSKKSGYRIVGDVDFEEVKKVAGWITPVPGGVGPMTIVMLLKNTLDGASREESTKNCFLD